MEIVLAYIMGALIAWSLPKAIAWASNPKWNSFYGYRKDKE